MNGLSFRLYGNQVLCFNNSGRYVPSNGIDNYVKVAKTDRLFRKPLGNNVAAVFALESRHLPCTGQITGALS